MFRTRAGTAENSPRISRQGHLEVGDRGATCTAAFQTPCFHVNLHCVAFHTVATPTAASSSPRVPARNTARLESLATLRAPIFAGSSILRSSVDANRSVHCLSPSEM